MRTRKGIALVMGILLAAPSGASAQAVDDRDVQREAAALPEQLWEPATDPVSSGGPGLPEDAGGQVAPTLAVALLLAAGGAGYAVSRYGAAFTHRSR